MSATETILIGVTFVLIGILWITLYPRPRVELSDRGLFDRSLRLGWIGWDEIEGAYPPKVEDLDGLLVRLRPGAALLRRLQRRAASEPTDDGAYELRLDLSETDISSVELLQEVLSRTAGNA